MEKQNYLWNSPAEDAEVRPLIGRGSSIGHHGEIFQGVYVNAAGHLQRGLVSLTSDVFRAEALFYPSQNATVIVKPTWKVKAEHAAQLTLDYCKVGQHGGSLVIKNNIPPSWGLGSSTSDVTAAIRAVGAAFGRTLPPAVVANLAVKAEIASDSIMYTDRAVLFAQREGLVLEEFSKQLPSFEVLGFNTNATGYETLGTPPARYSWWEIEAFRPLIGLLRKAVQTQDARLVGRVASASARINQRHLPKPHFDRLEKLTERVEALGLQVAHSGTVVGLLFDPVDVNIEEKTLEASATLAEVGITSSWRLRVSPDRSGEKARPLEPLADAQRSEETYSLPANNRTRHQVHFTVSYGKPHCLGHSRDLIARTAV
jgi:uncharacterized protein involved in propanediol utilization